MIKDWKDVSGSKRVSVDAVIVGSGPGGASVARVLAGRGLKVLVLEEGPARPRFEPRMSNAMRYHMQENGMMLARGSGMMPIAAGRGVGGGSLVNSAICFRTPEEVLNSWTNLLDGDDRFAAENLASVYEELESIIGVGVTSPEISGRNNNIIADGVKKLGLPGGLAPRNTPGCIGCAMCNMGCPSGGKASVDQNLLPTAINDGAGIQADIKVDRVFSHQGRVTGVAGTVRHPDTLNPVGELIVDSPIVVCSAGGIGTPRLLHHAGIADQLGERVGKGLHVHPGNLVLGLCVDPVYMWKGATQGAYFEVPSLPGVLPHTFSAPPNAVLLALQSVGEESKEWMEKLHRLCGCVVLVSDSGEGTVSAHRDGRAKIHYDFHPKDLVRTKKGMVETARVLFAGGAKQVLGAVNRSGWHSDVSSFEHMLSDRALADFTLYASHPMSSCRMGTRVQNSVVDSGGESHTLKGLYIADSSVFPTSLGVNPQLTTMVVATVIARNIR